MAEFVVTEGCGGPGKVGEVRFFETVAAANPGEEPLASWRSPLATHEHLLSTSRLSAPRAWLALPSSTAESLPLGTSTVGFTRQNHDRIQLSTVVLAAHHIVVN